LLSIIVAAGWPIWPLLACSVLALALVVERLASLQRSRILPARLLDDAMAASRQGIPAPEVVAKLERSSALGQILAAGFRALSVDPRCTEEELRFAMEAAGRRVAHQLERWLPALATIASAAPLLGLLGTVIGMIDIFGSQSPTAATSGAMAAGVGNPAQLAHGISIALYNTAFGLIVAIPTLMCWRYFRTRVDGYLLGLELAGESFARHLGAARKVVA
jgi:biopolymer transport protein ExbB